MAGKVELVDAEYPSPRIIKQAAGVGIIDVIEIIAVELCIIYWVSAQLMAQ